MHAVKLQENRRQPGLGELSGQGRIFGQTQPVGIELHKPEPGTLGQAHDVRQIIAHGRLTAGELQVAAAGAGHGLLEHAPQDVMIRIFFCPAAVGEAYRTVQVAARGDLDQCRAGALGMARAQAAVCLLYTSPSPRD